MIENQAQTEFFSVSSYFRILLVLNLTFLSIINIYRAISSVWYWQLSIIVHFKSLQSLVRFSKFTSRLLLTNCKWRCHDRLDFFCSSVSWKRRGFFDYRRLCRVPKEWVPLRFDDSIWRGRERPSDRSLPHLSLMDCNLSKINPEYYNTTSAVCTIRAIHYYFHTMLSTLISTSFYKWAGVLHPWITVK